MRFADATVDWNSHSFALITPDALIRGLVPSMVAHLERDGYDIRFGKLHWATSRDVDALYSDHIVRLWETYRFRLVDALLHLGPCLPVVLSHRTRRGQVMYEQLNALKGKSNPSDAEPGTIRADYGSVNALLSMMHASDDPDEAEREAAIFLASDDEVLAPADLLTAASAWFPLAGGPERRTFDDVLAGVRARIVVAAWSALPPALRVEFSATYSTSPLALADPTWGIPYADVLAAAGNVVLAEWLRAGFTPQTGTIDDLRTSRAGLVAFGVTLDDWETVVLETSSFFSPRRTVQSTT